MKKQHTPLVRLIALLAVALAVAGCRQSPAQGANENAGAAIETLIAAREKGVNEKDEAAYLSTVLPSDAVLLQEESNLIRAAGGLGITDYGIKLGSLRASGGGYTAWLEQSYTLDGVKKTCSYEAAFQQENGKYYYCGPDFELKQNNLVLVWYPEGEESLAQKLLNVESTVLAGMKQRLGFTPQGPLSIKLFDDKQVFLQSVKLDLPDWVGGWHEYGEAIKSYVGAYGSDVEPYLPMLNHETTHRMVSELSNDNASYWLQEGLAGVFENWLDNPDEGYLSETEEAMRYTPFSEQKAIDLEAYGEGDYEGIGKYYATSKAFAAFLLDRFGWEKMREALQYMEKFNRIHVTGAEKIPETNARTDEALRAVYGMQDDAAFQAAFDEWQAALR